jgi:hypothetical protein
MASKQTAANEDWLDFERMIQRIESALAPLGAVVEHNIKVHDFQSEEPRQIDVCIRYPREGQQGLVTVECRKRETKSDVQWIDLLVGKRAAIRADRTIAVCFKGLSAPALEKAQATGIEVRSIKEITPEEISSWCEVRHMLYVPPSLTGARIHLFDDRLEYINPADFSAATLRAIAKQGNEAPVVFMDGKGTSLNAIIMSYQNAFRGTKEDLHHGVAYDGKPVLKVVHFQVDPNRHLVKTEKGPRRVAFALLAVLVKLEIQKVEPAIHFEYSTADGSLAKGVEFRAEGEKAIAATLSKTDDGKMKLTIGLRHDEQKKSRKKSK